MKQRKKGGRTKKARAITKRIRVHHALVRKRGESSGGEEGGAYLKRDSEQIDTSPEKEEIFSSSGRSSEA